jgi:tetratricopeptide (TPR) repeat protein
LIGFGINYYLFVQNNQKTTDFNIKKYETIFTDTMEQYRKIETSKVNEMKLKYHLIMNNFKELKRLLNKLQLSNEKTYLKYYGILCFKMKEYDKAVNYLNLYLKKYKYDEDVISYLGNIYFLRQNFTKAVLLYNSIKNDNFETSYNKAIIYEKSGNLKRSLEFYKKSYSLARDPLMKKRIFSKIFLMENYESQQN